jgi:hypothetical protein
MKFQKTILFSTGLALISAMISSCATVGGGYSASDTNNDGQVAVAELESTLLQAILASGDVDQNGKISWSEWKTSNPNADEKKFRDQDLDDDNELSFAEAEAAARSSERWSRLMGKIDSNKNGTIEPEEAIAFQKSMKRAKGDTPVAKLSWIADQP